MKAKRRNARRRWAVGTVGCLALVAGCRGIIGGDEPPDVTGPDPTGLSCDESAGPTATPMRRLSREQYINTIRHLVGDEVADDIQGALDRVPPDSLDPEHGRDYATQDQAVSQVHTDIHWDVATAASVAATNSPVRLEALVGACATDGDQGNDEACVRDFVRDFGRRALRRPLSDEEITFYSEDALGSTTDVSAVSFADRLVALLQAPQLIFRIEDGAAATEDDADLFPLTGYELAGRLAYHFWQAPPDDALLEAAADGSLETDEGFRAQLARLMADPRFDAALHNLVTGWLRLQDTPEYAGLDQNPQFMAFADGVEPNDALGQSMRTEVERLFAYYARRGTFRDLMMSDRSFATDEALAGIYEVPVWDGQGEPPAFDDPRRVGLLTRAAFVAAASSRSHPILRGVKIRQRVLCSELPPPPANAGMDAPTDADLVTSRKFAENLTQSSNECSVCHDMINPPGFVLGNFDALGRLQEEESLYATDGSLLATLPIDTEATISISPGEETTMRDPATLSEAIVQNDAAQTCLARHYFRFAYGRTEDVDADGCQLRSLRDSLIDGTIEDMMMQIALRPEFKLRRREP